MIGSTVSHYKILEKIGGGGMGVVYKAQDLKLDRHVALKFLPPELTRDSEARERFIHEAKAASALQHLNICTIHDIDETTDSRLFIVMDCYEGESLKQMIEQGPLPIDKAMDIATQVAQGLAKAHEGGIVHRDIKPANIMVGKDGIVRIVDFGLAKLSGQTMLTKSGSTVGTAAYMSPEQARGEKVDHRTDIWSLGVVLYEMLTGHQPFASEYEQAMMYAIMSGEPKPLEELRPQVQGNIIGIVQRAMEKDKEKRFQTSSEMAEKLRGIGKPQKKRMTKRKKRMLVFLAGADVIVLIAIGVYGVVHFRGTAGTIDAIAVLPAEDLSKDPRNEPLALGLADELISRLYQVRSLRVPSFRSVLSFRGTPKTLAEIGKELGVGALVTSTILRSGETIRLHVELIEAATDRPLWSKGYDRPIGDLIQLQTDVAQDIVKELRVALTPEEKTQLAVARKVDPKAYQLYLEARRTWYNLKADEREYHAAVASLEQAITIDPSYPAFYSLTAMMYQDGPSRGYYKALEIIPRTQKLVSTALSLEGRNSDSQVALAMLDMLKWNWKEAEAAFLRALEISPGSPEIHFAYAQLLLWLGRSEESIAKMKRASEIDPAMFANGVWMANCYNMSRRYDEAIALASSELKRFPEDAMLHLILASSYSPKGMCDSAIVHLGRSLALTPSAGEVFIDLNATYIYAMCGQHEQARVYLTRYLESGNHDTIEPYWVASGYAILGDTSNAYDWLERAYNEHSPALELLKIDNPWDGQHSNPRYLDMLKRIGLDK